MGNIDAIYMLMGEVRHIEIDSFNEINYGGHCAEVRRDLRGEDGEGEACFV